MVEDQTSKETLKEKETSGETAVDKEKSAGETQNETTEQEVDYKVKFVESQKEALRLKKELEAAKGVKPKETEKPKDSADLAETIRQEVRSQLAPLTAEQERKIVDDYLAQNPDAADYLEKIDELLPSVPGKTIREKLENAHLLAKKDKLKEAGEKELSFKVYQRSQAIAGGGGASASSFEEGLPPLTAKEKEVAHRMGISEEAYAKRKSETAK